MHADENEEEGQTFLEGINRDAPGLGRGGSLGFFFGRGSCGCAGKPFSPGIGRPFVCGGGTGFPTLVTDVVAVVVPFVPRSDSEPIESTRLTCGFITSLGFISSGI